ncbi:calcineurin-like phosphoesterase C-terminal domain-containing protein [uncultured Alistipes sp.]|uniref:calcineurin-like phosphoesterase C-terminal domain-containing protein n=1 Tax=uncultured Alistipes sp. TaxID=538949 RepID=UPI0025FE4720|nr:calcineurin-like phosphoesterase C-terminal domain-containing protein [uncultured Alistipes sp.]
MKKHLNLLYVLLLCIGCWGCEADESVENPSLITTIDVAEPAIISSYEGTTRYITISSNAAWTVNTQGSWLRVTPQGGNSGTTTIAVTIDPTADAAARSSGLLIASGNALTQLSLPVFQMTQEELAVYPGDNRNVEKEAATLALAVASYNDYNVDVDGDWITEESTRVISQQVREHTFSIAANDARVRSARITFTQNTSGATATVIVTQDGTRVIPDKEGATIKGEITCESIPLAGVVVSDGFEVTTTDEDGLYWLASQKKSGSVFISIPGGYMVENNASIPQFWQNTTEPANVVEEHSFRLRREPNKEHILLATTDTHMANRQNYNPVYNDTDQYRNDFRADINAFVAANSGKAVYAICLGDLTWDIYWYDKGTMYTLENYREEISNFPVSYFQVIGNHDYDMNFTDDFQAAGAYRRIIGPTYYSFNLGDVHYVVLDNMYYINSNDRNHDTYVDAEQLAWLKKDLSYVDKQKPVFVCMHCPAYDISSVSDGVPNVITNFTNSQHTKDLGDCFKDFANVHYLNGHTHINRAVANEDMPAGYNNIFEHNMAAVCATWWWTGYISRNSICKDGTEGGYMVFTNNGGDVSWRWKGMKVAADKQFRTYDMNTVKTYFTTDPSALAYRQKYPLRTNYSSVKANTVYINVWNWDSGWHISVKESGQELAVKQLKAEDPLHTLSYDIPRTAANGSLTSSFRTYSTSHMFSVEAVSDSSTLEIEVTDRFGVRYTESMARPKAFTTIMP